MNEPIVNRIQSLADKLKVPETPEQKQELTANIEQLMQECRSLVHAVNSLHQSSSTLLILIRRRDLVMDLDRYGYRMKGGEPGRWVLDKRYAVPAGFGNEFVWVRMSTNSQVTDFACSCSLGLGFVYNAMAIYQEQIVNGVLLARMERKIRDDRIKPPETNPLLLNDWVERVP